MEDIDVVPPTLDELTPTSCAPKWPMRNILIIGLKEIQEGLQPMGARDHAVARRPCADAHVPWERADRQRGVRALDVVIVSLSSLTILLPLIALLISHDAIVGEMERGTLLLLLSYPVAALAGAARQVRWSSGHPRLRDPPRLRRRRRRARRDRNRDRCRKLDSSDH